MGVFASGVLAGPAKVSLVVVAVGGLTAGAYFAYQIGPGGARTAVAQDVSFVSITIDSIVSDVGREVEAELEAQDIEGALDAWFIVVSYDPDVATALDCTPRAGGVCEVDSAASLVRVVSIDSAGLLEDTVLATLTFRCEAEGASELSLRSELGGVPENFREVETVDGTITCRESKAATATPEEVASAFVLPPTGTGSGATSSNWTAVLVLAALATLGTGAALNLRQTP